MSEEVSDTTTENPVQEELTQDSTEVSEKKPTELSTEAKGILGGLSKYSADSEAKDSSEVSLPFIKVLQSGSPPVKENDPVGARIGHLYNPASHELIDGNTGIELHVVARSHVFVEWKPKQGGKVKEYPITDPLIREAVDTQKFGKYKNPNHVREAIETANRNKDTMPDYSTCNELVETHYLWALMRNKEGDLEPVVLSFTSRKITPYLTWLRRALRCKWTNPETGEREKAPFMLHRMRLTTNVKHDSDWGDLAGIKCEPLIDGHYENSLLDIKEHASEIEQALEMREIYESNNYVIEGEESGDGDVDSNPQDNQWGSDVDEDDQPF